MLVSRTETEPTGAGSVSAAAAETQECVVVCHRSGKEHSKQTYRQVKGQGET